MARLLRSVLLLFLVQAAGGALTATAQQCYAKATAAEVAQMKFLVGTWQGQVVEQGVSRALLVRFYEQSGQVLASIQEQGRLAPLTAQAGLCGPGKFHFFGPAASGERFSYNARLQGGALAGTFAVGASCGKDPKPAFTLSRAVATP
jgi:hypothetical protein